MEIYWVCRKFITQFKHRALNIDQLALKQTHQGVNSTQQSQILGVEDAAAAWFLQHAIIRDSRFHACNQRQTETIKLDLGYLKAFIGFYCHHLERKSTINFPHRIKKERKKAKLLNCGIFSLFSTFTSLNKKC